MAGVDSRGTVRIRSLAALAMLICMVAPIPGRAAASKPTRSDHEATRLLPIVMARLPTPGRCGVDSDWSNEPVPDYVARSVFRFAVRAGLIPPFTTAQLRSVVDPQRRLPPNTFCSTDEFKAYAAQRVVDFEKGSSSSMQINRVALGYPIFDEPRMIAVVVVTRLSLEGRARNNGGKIARMPAGDSVEIEVFKRRGNRWRFARGVVTGIS